MKPLFTKALPPLSESLPACCGPFATWLSKPNLEEAKKKVKLCSNLPTTVHAGLLYDVMCNDVMYNCGMLNCVVHNCHAL